MNFIFQKLKAKKLPLYLVIGLPGAGKSTFIAHNVDVLEKEKLLGNVTLFRSKQSIFLEISLIAHEIAPAIVTLSTLLKAHLPIKGIFIVTQVSCVVRIYQEQKTYENDLLNSLLTQLLGITKRHCAVHIIFSHFDKIAGFQSFFEYLLADHSLYWLGFDCGSRKKSNLLASIEQGFVTLQHTLEGTMMKELAHASCLEKRRCIQQFPYQITYVQTALVAWLKSLAIFHTNSIWEMKSWYGTGYVYQSSALEKENYNPVLVDLMKSDIIASHDIVDGFADAAVDKNRTVAYQKQNYFLGSQYFNYLHECYQASPARRKRIYFVWPSIIFFFFLSASSLLYYYRINIEMLNTVKHALLEEQTLHNNQKNSKTSSRSLVQSIEHFDYLQHALTRLEAWHIFPIKKQALITTLQDAYSQAIQRELWVHLQHLIATIIRQEHQPPETGYKTLKAWLMLKHPEKANTAFLTKQLLQIAQASLVNTSLQASLQRDIGYFVKMTASEHFKLSTSSTQLDQAIDRMRSRLIRLPKAQLITFALNSLFEEKCEVYPFKNRLSIPEYTLFKEHPEHLAFPAQYSANYFSQIYSDIIPQLTQAAIAGKDWVLTEDTVVPSAALSDTDTRKLIETVRAHWLTCYANAWKAKCKQLQLKEMRHWKAFQQCFVRLQTLQFPFAGIVSTIAEHTQLESLQKTLPQWKLQDRHLIDRYLSHHFKGLEAFDNTLVIVLENLQHYLKPVFNNTDPEQAAFHLLRQLFLSNASENPLSELFEKSVSLPAPIGQCMHAIAVQIRDRLFENTQHYLDRVWHDQVFVYYKAYLKERYPLFKNSSNDVRLTDFIEFFGAQGKIGRYMQEYLTPFIDRTQTRWQLRQYQGQSLAISPGAITQLERAYIIQQLFFKVFIHAPIHFKIKAVDVDSTLRTNLHYGKSLYDLTKSGFAAPLLHWPEIRAENDVKITLYTPQGIYATQVFSGVWAWFRLLDTFKQDNSSVPIIFAVSAKDYTMRYEVWLAEEDNIFIAGILEDFRCPLYLTA